MVREEKGTENEKARPVGRAGLGAGASNSRLGGHPDTCNVAATRGAVVAVHMMEIRRAHDGRRVVGRMRSVNFFGAVTK